MNKSKSCLIVSGRMEKVTGSSTGERLNATILTAFAAEDKVNGGYFHVEKNLAQDGECSHFVVSLCCCCFHYFSIA